MLRNDYLFICSQTGEIFRNPVVASDGYHYELHWLLDRVKNNDRTNPITGEILTYVEFDLQLKNQIETIFPQQSQEVDLDESLKKLNELLASPYAPWRQSIYKSILTANMAVTYLALRAHLLEEDIDASSLLFTLSLTVATDYAFRAASFHQFGLFGTLSKGLNTAIKGMKLCWDVIGSVDPDEDEAVFRL